MIDILAMMGVLLVILVVKLISYRMWKSNLEWHSKQYKENKENE